ncbi:hypothetical protein RY831_03820 [Noviherbaspirillum sp. CPCC 100848]|uniref:Uncharacterized protein n=2 Tax=Noviherbaspirillum album TaxID=3080276 RepID=A0ABU6J3S0_9BURK|nr:hypothetical protein [Noviherbaspirillum sp. CPCC 100848]
MTNKDVSEMRFTRYYKDDFRDTPRKRAALLRKQRNEREAFPLFADQIAEQQPDVDTVMDDRARKYAEHMANNRAYRAMKWRQGRARMRSYPEVVRAKLMDYWNTHRWLPAEPSYFLDMMHMYDHARLDLNAPGIRRTA